MQTIYQTKDYSLFDAITGNRILSTTKIDKICADINNGFNMLPYCPIIVSEKGNKFCVIDGQHRLQVSKKTDNPVYYVVCTDLTLKQIALLNSRAEKWKPSDFLNCYINLGLNDYQNIKEVMQQHKVSIKLAIDLLMFNSAVAKSTDVFQSGEFKCNYKAETDQLLEFVESIFGQYTFSKDRYLIAAIQAIQKRGVIDWARFRTKLTAKPLLMNKQNDTKNYIYNIERIYNDGVQNRVLLS